MLVFPGPSVENIFWMVFWTVFWLALVYIVIAVVNTYVLRPFAKKLPRFVYTLPMVAAVVWLLIGIVFVGHEPQEGPKDQWKDPEVIEVTPVEEVREKGKELTEEIETDVKKASDEKRDELRGKSDDMFDKLWKKEKTQREAEKKSD